MPPSRVDHASELLFGFGPEAGHRPFVLYQGRVQLRKPLDNRRDPVPKLQGLADTDKSALPLPFGPSLAKQLPATSIRE